MNNITDSSFINKGSPSLNQRPDQSVPTNKDTKGASNNKHVLIAEDDKFLGNAYRVKLEKSGYQVTLARDGVEAMEELSKGSDFCLIILDLIMPKKDGFATLEEIKQQPSLKDIPILIASNLGQKEDIDRGIKLGANDYIIKSDYSMGEILDKIRKLTE
ncbi:response regulator [Candidatus Nomurabacteria bacterium]|uniref:Response regulator n=1 Tax=candidate division WWE3 bacterium TaxID=2053526 RepID=A0A955E1K1_UNCKA|nr:response regulator [candidate division WWE3 bacterium]MCB9823992.1 response regulator [Candidatus Nomurabacteria bacterium]MCB9827037.1 response regulator [Candidatus Nomurabacteria bacterium]MCB9827933.1 response regulator [Candidatus Nomurabacteria bacterium]HXK52892.1 response regulator [bacterium]